MDPIEFNAKLAAWAAPQSKALKAAMPNILAKLEQELSEYIARQKIINELKRMCKV